MTQEQWLKLCFGKWTTSTVQSAAWKYRNDYAGFVAWFLDGNRR